MSDRLTIRRSGSRILISAVLSASAALLMAGDAPVLPDGLENQEAVVEQGRYLVHHVAQCIQCHTPRDASGVLIESRLLTGAPIPVAGPANSKPWAAASVSLAGLGNYEDAFVRQLLTTGNRPDGTQPKSPMPMFRLSADDAAAVIAYLKSVTLASEGAATDDSHKN